ncbi:hypothetical protein KJ903_02845 [Patescibacteria group bacterium]|nr:hypothetical protein [Patescibacteria group bacterium]
MKRLIIILVVFLVILLLAGAAAGGFFYFQKKTEEPQNEDISQSVAEPDQTQDNKLEIEKVERLKLDSAKEATHLSKVADTKGVYWLRQFGLVWNDVESDKGEYDWSRADEQMKYLNEAEVYPLVNIRPFANWDQDVCHPEEKYKTEFDVKKGGQLKVGKPCDMEAYAKFLAQVVERYDGDKVADMPGLKIPVKYWEIINEPSMQGSQTGGAGEELKFFVGTSQEYLDILKTSYQTIKQTDPEAKVLPAGMAGIQHDFQNFWQPVLANGGGNYFDIANIHTINTDERRDDLYMMKYKKFLEQYDIKDKPIWITEVQYGDLMGKPKDLASFEKSIAKSTVFALAQGADKLFYIENWLYWDNMEKYVKPDKGSEDSMSKEEEAKEKEKKKKPELSPETLNSSTHKVYLNLVDKVNTFDRIETIKEEYQENPSQHDGATSQVGQYKFISGGKTVYVLWGQAKLPAEITGRVLVTDIYGDSEEREANGIVLSDNPVFIEMN